MLPRCCATLGLPLCRAVQSPVFAKRLQASGIERSRSSIQEYSTSKVDPLDDDETPLRLTVRSDGLWHHGRS